MFKFNSEALFLGHTGHVHQAGTVRSGNESGTSLHVALNLVQSHLRADGCLFNREHAPESATLIGSFWLQDLDTLYQIQQIFDFIELWHVLLTRRTQSQLTDTMTGVVKTHLVGEGAQRMIDFDYIVQELHHIHRFLGSLAFRLAFQQARIVQLDECRTTD